MIRRLLHIEQIKLLNYNPFRITLGIYFLAFALGLLIYPAIDKEIPVISLSDLFRFPDVWLFLTWVTEPYNILLALVIIMITTKEFNNHTFKTQLIFGLSRTELLLQKLMLIVVLALFATLLLRRPRKSAKPSKTSRQMLLGWLLALLKPAAKAWLVTRAKKIAAEQVSARIQQEKTMDTL